MDPAMAMLAGDRVFVLFRVAERTGHAAVPALAGHQSIGRLLMT